MFHRISVPYPAQMKENRSTNKQTNKQANEQTWQGSSFPDSQSAPCSLRCLGFGAVDRCSLTDQCSHCCLHSSSLPSPCPLRLPSPMAFPPHHYLSDRVPHSSLRSFPCAPSPVPPPTTPFRPGLLWGHGASHY